MSDFLSVSEYAAIYHKDAGNIRRMLICGRLEGKKVGNQWIIPANSVYPADNRLVTGRYVNQRKRAAFNKNRDLSVVIKKMIDDLRNIYGDNLDSIVLYGSYSRGEQNCESDVDIALFVKSYDISARGAMSECVAGYELEAGKVLSVIDILKSDYDIWKNTLPLYRNIRKEGIILWKAV